MRNLISRYFIAFAMLALLSGLLSGCSKDVPNQMENKDTNNEPASQVTADQEQQSELTEVSVVDESLDAAQAEQDELSADELETSTDEITDLENW